MTTLCEVCGASRISLSAKLPSTNMSKETHTYQKRPTVWGVRRSSLSPTLPTANTYQKRPIHTKRDQQFAVRVAAVYPPNLSAANTFQKRVQTYQTSSVHSTRDKCLPKETYKRDQVSRAHVFNSLAKCLVHIFLRARDTWSLKEMCARHLVSFVLKRYGAIKKMCARHLVSFVLKRYGAIKKMCARHLVSFVLKRYGAIKEMCARHLDHISLIAWWYQEKPRRANRDL